MKFFLFNLHHRNGTSRSARGVASGGWRVVAALCFLTPLMGFSGAVAGQQVESADVRSYDYQIASVDYAGTVKSRTTRQARSITVQAGGVVFDLVPVPSGRFLMGAPAGDKSAAPQHAVNVSGYFIGKFETTLAQWRAVAALPKVRTTLPDNPLKKADADAAFPVWNVSWDEAVEFCARLSRATGKTFRLPTEAEWEYACRAGSTRNFAFGDNVTPDLVNYNGRIPFGQAPTGTNRNAPLPVGSLGVANAFGLFDLHGNVAEWCQDEWHATYAGAPGTAAAWTDNPAAEYRVVRGGSYGDGAFACVSSARGKAYAPERFEDIGFRVVMEGDVRSVIPEVRTETAVAANDAPSAGQTPAAAPVAASAPTMQSPGDLATIPAGTTIKLNLQTPANSKVSTVGDEVVAYLETSLRIDGKLVLPKGTEFRGTVAEVTAAKVGQRQAMLKLVFDQIVLSDGGTQPVKTQVTLVQDFRREGKLAADKDGRLNGGHSGGRTVNNAIKGGILGSLGASTVIWGGGGAGPATGTLGGTVLAGVLLTKGNDVALDRGTIVHVKFGTDTKVSTPGTYGDPNGQP